MRDRLPVVLRARSVDLDQKDRLVKLVCEDDDVKFFWSMLSIDIDSEHHAGKLFF